MLLLKKYFSFSLYIKRNKTKRTSRRRGQQLLTWGTVSSRYKYNSKLQETFGGTVETTGTKIKTGFCITKMPYKEFFWHSMALNCEVSSLMQLKFELYWDFMPVLVVSKFEEDVIENEPNFFSTTKGNVTKKRLIRSGRNSNLSEILCLSSLPVSLMAIEFRVIEKRWIHHFLQCKSMGK